MDNTRLPLPGSWWKLGATQLFPRSVQSDTWQQMNDPTKSWSYSIPSNSSVCWKTDIHAKKDEALRSRAMARAPHTIFIFLHQSVANRTHRSRACKALENVISMQMSLSLSRLLLAKAASPPGRGGQHIHSCVHWNLADVSKRRSKKDLTGIYLIYKLEWLYSQVALDMAGKNATARTSVVWGVFNTPKT